MLYDRMGWKGGEGAWEDKERKLYNNRTILNVNMKNVAKLIDFLYVCGIDAAFTRPPHHKLCHMCTINVQHRLPLVSGKLNIHFHLFSFNSELIGRVSSVAAFHLIYLCASICRNSSKNHKFISTQYRHQ